MRSYTRNSWSKAQLYSQFMVKSAAILAIHGQTRRNSWSNAQLYSQFMVKSAAILAIHGQKRSYTREHSCATVDLSKEVSQYLQQIKLKVDRDGYN
jgi:hypothetical protein